MSRELIANKSRVGEQSQDVDRESDEHVGRQLSANLIYFNHFGNGPNHSL